MVDRNTKLNEYAKTSAAAMPDDDLIICRCEEITKGEIRRAVHDGMWNLHEVRRFLRCGMGLCQGLTCSRLVKSIILRELAACGISHEKVSPAAKEDARARAPMRPTEMQVLANEKDGRI